MTTMLNLQGYAGRRLGTAGLVDLLVGRGQIAAIEVGHGTFLHTHIDPSGQHQQHGQPEANTDHQDDQDRDPFLGRVAVADGE